MSEWVEGIRARVADHQSWPEPDSDDLAKLLFDSLVAYGLDPDHSTVPDLRELYEHCLNSLRASVRYQLYTELAQLVDAKQVSLNALVAVIFVETDRSIAASAAIDYSYCYLPSVHDPIAGPRAVAGWSERRVAANPGALFGGLVCLGDDRVFGMLSDLKSHLTDDEVSEASLCTSHMPTVGAFEFWLGWLEELQREGHDESRRFGSCAKALSVLVQTMKVPVFGHIRRHFGYIHYKDYPDRVSSSEPLQILERVTLPELASRYGLRMRDLESAEAPPKVMSSVLMHYGMEPGAPASERFVEH